jgi:hypothetical protein
MMSSLFLGDSYCTVHSGMVNEASGRLVDSVCC